MTLEEAARFAVQVVGELAPHCLRIEVAGSIRRRKPDGIKDVEIVAIPKPPFLEFGKKPGLAIWLMLDELRSRGQVLPRYNKKGNVIAWGAKYRATNWRGVPVDIFLAEPDNWGVILLLRTGPAEWNHKLVTSEAYGGWMSTGLALEGGRLVSFTLHSDDEPTPIATLEESDVFRALGLPWIDPWERTVEKLSKRVAA